MVPFQNIFWIFLIFVFFGASEASKILCVFSCPSYSHQMVFRPIWLELARKGHDVTVITPNIEKNHNFSNLRQIDVSFGYSELHKNIHFANSTSSSFLDLNTWKKQFREQQTVVMAIDEKILQMDQVQKILNQEKFDLVFVQWFTATMLGLGPKLGCPIVAVTSLTPYNFMYESFGNPAHPVLGPEYMTGLEGDLSFYERIEATVFSLWQKFYYWTEIIPEVDRIIRENMGENLPSLSEIQYNISFLFLNVNPLVTTSRPNVANVIEFSGLQLREQKPLPEDLQSYLDTASEGVIYFSLGTNVKSSLLPLNLRTTILEALGELPFKVLWKFETDFLPDRPKNVMIKKWIPQQDVLGHKNVKLFLMQGGAQSIEEAIDNEVPVVGIPFFSDQPRNIKICKKLGIGLGVDRKTVTKDELKRTILEVINNKKYKDNIRKRRTILKDQPIKSLDKVIWYIEYALRHKGPQYFKSSYPELPFWKYFFLDQIMFLVILIASMAVLSKISLNLILRIIKNHSFVKIKTT